VQDALVRAIELRAPEPGESRRGYPWHLPVVRALADGLQLHPRVTYLIGENGSGKSTLLEALAVAAGMNPEGGSSNFTYQTRQSHSVLWESIRLIRGARRPRTDFFLRAESLFTAATYIESLGRPGDLGGDPLTAYGGRSLHEQSHGEAFLAVMINRFGPDGFYVLDEPEAALSTQNCLTFLRRVHELAREGSQFVIATHSPIVLAYPDATILACTDADVAPVRYDDAEPVRLTRGFLDAPDAFLRALFSD
jgi:predicted ATPase